MFGIKTDTSANLRIFFVISPSFFQVPFPKMQFCVFKVLIFRWLKKSVAV